MAEGAAGRQAVLTLTTCLVRSTNYTTAARERRNKARRRVDIVRFHVGVDGVRLDVDCR